MGLTFAIAPRQFWGGLQTGSIGMWGEYSGEEGTRFLKGDTASPQDSRAIMRGHPQALNPSPKTVLKPEP